MKGHRIFVWVIVGISVGNGLCAVAQSTGTAQSPFPTHEPPFNPDRPGIADGSTVVGRHLFQIETGVQREYRSDGPQNERMLFIPTLLRYGWNDRWEFRVESNTLTRTRSFDPVDGVSRTSGYSPVSLGFKCHLQDQPEGSKRPSLGTILRIFPASGSTDFRSHHVTGDLRLAADWTFAPHWSLNPNMGIALYEDDTGRTFTSGLAAVTLSRDLSERLTVFVDTAFQTPEAKGSASAMMLDAGVMYLLNKNTQIDFNPGKRLNGRTTAKHYWTAGISRRF